MWSFRKNLQDDVELDRPVTSFRIRLASALSKIGQILPLKAFTFPVNGQNNLFKAPDFFSTNGPAGKTANEPVLSVSNGRADWPEVSFNNRTNFAEVSTLHFISCIHNNRHFFHLHVNKTTLLIQAGYDLGSFVHTHKCRPLMDASSHKTSRPATAA